jgi:hypothetical protein
MTQIRRHHDHQNRHNNTVFRWMIRLLAVLSIAAVSHDLWWAENSMIMSRRKARDPSVGGGGGQVPSKLRVKQLTASQIMAQKARESAAKFNSEHTLTLADFPDLVAVRETFSSSDETWNEAAANRKPLMDLLEKAGDLKVDLEVLRALPTWETVTKLYGDKPVILGQETCQQFRDNVPVEHRYAGVAGQMNTGTNALAKLLRNNLNVPENTAESEGILWTVPWYKHSWVDLWGRYRYQGPQNHSFVLPVVLVRDPYFWMNSMCQSPYTMRWKREPTHCPNLVPQDKGDFVDESDGVAVDIKWGMNYRRKWYSLADVWNSWYREYFEATNIMPRLMIRFEDLLFHPEEVVEAVRECVGAEYKHAEFQYQAGPAKTHPYFSQFKKNPSSMISAWVKYGQNRERAMRNMTTADRMYAAKYLDEDLMRQFHYQPPVTT